MTPPMTPAQIARTGPKLADELTALAERLHEASRYFDAWGDERNRNLVNEAAAALTARSDGWREGVEAAAKVAEGGSIPFKHGPALTHDAYGRDIAAAIRAITPPETTP